MRVRRRSSAGAASGYRFYRIVPRRSASDFGSVHVAELRLVSAANPDGIPTGGSVIAGVNPAAAGNLFDEDHSTYWTKPGGADNPSYWAGYQFNRPRELVAYKVGVRSGTTRTNDPRWWRFEASEDGVEWDVLDAQSGLTWTSGQIREFPL